MTHSPTPLSPSSPRRSIAASPRRILLCIGALLLSFALPSRAAQPEGAIIDFRFSPAHYLTAICLPDDWQKTLVTETGALAYDFGPGPYARPLTEVSFGLRDARLRVEGQSLDDPRVPIVATTLRAESGAIRQQSFALVRESRRQHTGASLWITPRVRRIGGLNGAIGWSASVAGAVDPAFRNAAWGTNRAIRYRVKVAPGSRHRVALGLVEPYKGKAGLRILELRVEGAPPRTFDPMAQGEKNRAQALLFDARDENGDGELAIESHCAPESPDPNAFLNAFWVFPPDAPVAAEDLIRGAATAKADVAFACGTELEATAPAPALDGLSADFEGGGVPVIAIRSPREFAFDPNTGLLQHDGLPYLLSRPRALSVARTGNQWQLVLPAGTKHAELVVLHGGKGREAVREAPELAREMEAARRYWRERAPVPRGRMRVPDEKLQYLIEASVRNLYQIREFVDGAMEFHPGPTVYRGLWMPDSLFAGSTVLILNDLESQRRFLEGAMRHQLPTGQVRVLEPLVSPVETPDFVYAVCRYGMMANDAAWMRAHWDAVAKGVEWIRRERATTLGDASLPWHGILPPGFVDGGIADLTADYGTTWWALAAIEKGIAAARWLGNTRQADDWQRLFDEFLRDAKRTAARDLRVYDKTGLRYLPVRVGVRNDAQPLKAQHAFIFPAQYGRFFEREDDPLLREIVNGNLALLGANLKQGIVFGTAWRDDGVWGWLGAAHAITLSIFDRHREAQQMVYAVANHFTPTGVQVEEQQTKDIGTGTSGDHSNAEASAIFLHALRLLLARERGANLDLLAGLPVEWLKPGARVELNDTLTDFGPLTLRLAVSADARVASLAVDTVDRKQTGTVRVSLLALREAGFAVEKDRVETGFGAKLRLSFKRK